MEKHLILEELLIALNTANDPNAFCKNLVHGLLSKEQAFAAHLLYLGNNSRFRILGAYGYGDHESAALESSVWSDSLAAQSIRSKALVAFEYENSDGSSSRSFQVAFPLLDSNVPLGSLGLEFAHYSSKAIPSHSFQGSLNITGVAAIKRFANRDQRAAEFEGGVPLAPAVEFVLNKRQFQVLSGIREELSNAQIAEQLHLSESSIKQETVRLFRALGVKNRVEARRLALDKIVGQ